MRENWPGLLNMFLFLISTRSAHLSKRTAIPTSGLSIRETCGFLRAVLAAGGSLRSTVQSAPCQLTLRFTLAERGTSFVQPPLRATAQESLRALWMWRSTWDPAVVGTLREMRTQAGTRSVGSSWKKWNHPSKLNMRISSRVFGRRLRLCVYL